MKVLSKLYRFGLISLALSMPLSVAMTAYKMPLSLAQNESSTSTSENSGQAKQEVSPQLETTDRADNVDFIQIEEELGITSIISSENYMIGIQRHENSSLNDQFQQYFERSEYGAELTLEAIAETDDMPNIVVVIKDRESIPIFEIARHRWQELSVNQSVVVQLNIQQGKLYIADNDEFNSTYSITIRETFNDFGNSAGVEIEKDQAASFDYRAWASGGGFQEINLIDLDTIRDQGQHLSLDSSRELTLEETRQIIMSPNGGSGIHNRR